MIVFTDWAGRSPKEVEDQVTYPLVTSLQGLPGVRVVRASSAFSFSMVNVIFEDNVELYWARTRVLERLNLVAKQLPEGVTPTLGPDATGVGQVFWYTLESDKMRPSRPCARCRIGSFAISSIPCRAWPKSRRSADTFSSIRSTSTRTSCGLTTCRFRWSSRPFRRSNNNVGGNVVEQAGEWAVVRGVGLIQSTSGRRGYRHHLVQRNARFMSRMSPSVKLGNAFASALSIRTAKRPSAAW